MINKEDLIELLQAQTLSTVQLQQLDWLIEEYPWFNLPRVIKLRDSKRKGNSTAESELGLAAIFCNDRKALFQWITDSEVNSGDISSGSATEIEFLTSEDSEEEEIFELIDDNLEELDEADLKAIPEKNDTELEDNELDDIEAVPTIEPLDDIEDEDEEIEESQYESNQEESKFESAPETRISEESVKAAEIVEQATELKDNPSRNLIEQFLERDPGVIKADAPTRLEGDVSTHSIKEDDRFITDTLAKIYVKQGLHAKAIYAYERLSLKYPEKSAYFAAQIEKIKNLTNN